MQREANNLKLTAVLFRAMQSVEKVIQKDIYSYDINTSEFSAMELLYNRGPQPMRSMAKRILLANSSTTYTIDKLVEKAWLKRYRDPHDKRRVMVDLTDEGRFFFEKIFKQHQQLLSSLYSVLSDEEMETLILLLKKMGHHAKAKVEKQ